MAEAALSYSDLSRDTPEAPAPRSRTTLLKRLTDVVCLPSSRVNTFERAMTADLLVEMLNDASVAERTRTARRMCQLADAPNNLLRRLLLDEAEVAQPLLEGSHALTDADLVMVVMNATTEHRKLVARRRDLAEIVGEALLERAEPAVIQTLLRNETARLSQPTMDVVVAASRDELSLIPWVLRRRELRPSQAYVMFWWADAEARRTILQRFAVSREVLQDMAGDVFPIAAAEGWQDASSRKALQFIERRQRNRAAIDKSPFGSLEDAVRQAQSGLTREIAEEISYLAGIKPMTGAKILADDGGEPIAILCKAAGLPKAAVRAIWRGLRRPETDSSGALLPPLERVMITYDSMAVDRAQTVLRYWNWSLSSALTPALLQAIREGETEPLDGFSVPQRAAMLALGGEYGR
ncbi:MAG: DUF2336 domain-containing protein [Proteobacteria bacterium]|nr:DUF2336 domain-containing protein [Pseudomonadota bacterium]MBW3616254.1 DUF2336 domain-containing protein [Pseudomonadota bacterium]